MADIQNLGLFILAGWLRNLTPGPDVLYIVSSALRSGAKAGVVAALGVSALMAASSTAFTVLNWAGAACLFYVGVKLLLSPAKVSPEFAAEKSMQKSAEALKSIFFKGFFTNALNPKVALFFLAFVPQFIAPGASHPALTFVLLGVMFVGFGAKLALTDASQP